MNRKTMNRMLLEAEKRTAQWVKPSRRKWYRLESLSMRRVGAARGVYIIWQLAPDGRGTQVVYVGQGRVAARLGIHRRPGSRLMRKAKSAKGLWVTWARVGAEDMDGVESYLATKLLPIYGDLWTNAPMIRVNLPCW